MDFRIQVFLLLFGIAIAAMSVLAAWTIRSRRAALADTVEGETPSDDAWRPTAEQPGDGLLREERHIVRTSDAPGPTTAEAEASEAADEDSEMSPYEVVRQERFRALSSGRVVAKIPERRVAAAESLEHGRELAQFLQSC